MGPASGRVPSQEKPVESSSGSERDWRGGGGGADLRAIGPGEEGLRSEGGQSRGGFRIPGRPVTGFESGTVFRVCQELLPTGSGVRGQVRAGAWRV